MFKHPEVILGSANCECAPKQLQLRQKQDKRGQVTAGNNLRSIQSKRRKTKMSQVICQNVPSIFSLYLIKLEIANIFVNTLVKMSRVKTSQSQNIPESKHHKLKCPKSKCPKSKRFKVKPFQVKTSHLVCLPVNNFTHTVMKFLVYTSNMLYYSDNLLSTSLWNHEPEPWCKNKINGNI